MYKNGQCINFDTVINHNTIITMETLKKVVHEIEIESTVKVEEKVKVKLPLVVAYKSWERYLRFHPNGCFERIYNTYDKESELAPVWPKNINMSFMLQYEICNVGFKSTLAEAVEALKTDSAREISQDEFDNVYRTLQDRIKEEQRLFNHPKEPVRENKIINQ